MKRELAVLRAHLQRVAALLDSTPFNPDKVLEPIFDLPVLISSFDNDKQYGTLMSVIHSLLTDSVRVTERDKLQQAYGFMSAMLDNLERGELQPNEKLQQEFFKKWLAPKPGAPRAEGQVPIVSAADYLDDDDNIEKFFAIEAKEMLARMRICIQELRSEKRWRDALSELKSITHTLKGSAGIVGDRAISRLAHMMEEVLNLDRPPNQSYLTMMEQVCDSLKWLVQSIGSDQVARDARGDAATRLIEELRDEQEPVERQLTIDGSESTPPTPEEDEKASSVNITLERMSLLMEETDAARSMLMEDIRQIRAIGQSIAQSVRVLEEAENSMRPSKSKKRRKQSPREQKAAQARLEEIFGDIEEYFRLMEHRLEGSQEGLDKLQELGSRGWKEIARSRRIPIGKMFGVFQKTVRELAAAQGLKILLKTSGEQLQVEKKLFETLFDPLLQLIRNAISHGIEAPEKRIAAGKPEAGVIEVCVDNDGDDILITVSDDGCGLDLELLKRKASERLGGKAEDLADEELIFVSGLTTKKSIDEVAGRGIGMDVVATGINKLNGILQVESRRGAFTRFHIRIPSSRFYATAYIVRALGHLFAIPNALVFTGDVGGDSNDRFFNREDYSRITLSRLLGGAKTTAGSRPKLLVGAVEKRFLLEVDEIVGEQSVVMTKLGRFFRHLPLIWGATLIREGEMAFVLNLRALHAVHASQVREPRERIPRKERRGEGTPATILAVDDSISVREYLRSFLGKHGYEVHVAGGGVEALKLLRRHDYSLIITDLEMPGVDGYELINRLRRVAPSIQTPLLVISSRSAREERRRLLDRGVAAFQSKPFDEKELLRTIKELIC